MKYDESYPLLKEADQEIAQFKAAIAQANETRYVTETTDRDPTFELLREDIAKSQADLAAQRATLAATKQSIKSIQGQMVNLDQQSIAQQDLLRDAKADESNYLLYLSKREQERTTDALDNTRIANVAIAVPPAIPVLPEYGWSLILLAATGLAMVTSIGAAYAANFMDSSSTPLPRSSTFWGFLWSSEYRRRQHRRSHMVLRHFNLREQPFGVTPDPRFIYASATHREALASILYGIEAGVGLSH